MRAAGRRVDLSRYVRALGWEVRPHLDTSRGFPTHHRVKPGHLRRLRLALKSPHAATRASAVAELRRRILGREPSPLPHPPR